MTLLAPVALYPDPLLTQILVASTFPLDVVKADRWVAANADLATDARSAAAEAEGWDPSVAVLAAGFPTVVQRMAADLDSTETLGDAVLAQTDDVLDSVQRLRAQAAATGYLDSNEAQTVTEDEGGEIAIAPADPEVVYVPSYDPAMAFTTAPTAPTVVTTDPIYTQPGTRPATCSRPGRSPSAAPCWSTRSSRTTTTIGTTTGGRARSTGTTTSSTTARTSRSKATSTSTAIAWSSTATGPTSTGTGSESLDPDRVRDGSWQPDPAQRDEARAKLEQRQAARERPVGAGGGDRAALEERLGAGGAAGIGAAAGAAAGAGAARAKLEKSAARREGGPPRKATMETPFSPKREGAPQVRQAHERGASSVAASRSPAAAKAKSRSVSKASQTRPAVHKSSAKSTAFKKPKSGGAKAQHSASRGKSSAGEARRWRRRAQAVAGKARGCTFQFSDRSRTAPWRWRRCSGCRRPRPSRMRRCSRLRRRRRRR